MVWSRWQEVAVLGSLLACAGCQVRGLIGSDAEGSGSGGTAVDSTTTGAAEEATGNPSTTTGAASDAHGGGTTSTGGEATSGFIFDVLPEDLPPACAPPSPASCDADSDDPWHAIGLGCPGGIEIEASYAGDPASMLVHTGGLGLTDEYDPREGDKYVILSTGVAAHVPMSLPELFVEAPGCTALGCPSSSLDSDVMLVLPEPLDVRRVADDRDCSDDSTLVGQGDCSNTLEDQWLEGSGARDYTELRMQATVPPTVDGLAYDFAFFSSEYPVWAGHDNVFNDMYVAWLESEAWTGNISFDEMGHPITVNSVFLDFQSGQTYEQCESVPEVPELEGFSMQCHGGTKWLTTTAPVREGEQIELVFALFDLTDGILDSVVAIDNYEWTCSGEPPVTVPAG